MSRNIGDVIDQMLTVIPADADELRERMEWHKKDVSYKPPELLSHCWTNLAVSLYELIGEPTEGWQKEVQTIFNGGSGAEANGSDEYKALITGEKA